MRPMHPKDEAILQELDRLEALYPKGRPGRNDPCPCGSGRKFKRCCLNTMRPAKQVVQQSSGRRDSVGNRIFLGAIAALGKECIR